ncbi:hypothetical protein ASC77_04150 [Nocardioides sp. Root1257]|uniref:type IV toxin-antitoxin system AbiEi family antitoxin domain-containing protein n=1 Tax=unclassified Nocardioides TaxID=2615069 RepID=UPI00070185C6|nr:MULTISPECIES: type IV toxin-antitoxin system AbiEi family antitoxin domain-containing protein [unclassified Nocardioides]KQW53481.1 hypothetical protein ASC77_04150 [Nocardioides sp. Root1257]KRC56167.1 hypothetical protein ASE24_04150 [Nocardioides sp. Root224]
MDLAELMRLQCGVVSRSQLVAAGVTPHDVARMVRGRELMRLHAGVYVEHTGPPTWRQRAWAACLRHGPAALAGPSALRAVMGPGWRGYDDAGPIHVAIDHARRSADVVGHRVRRVVDLDEQVLWSASPPRMRTEEAALDVALARPDRLARIALLSDVCQSRRTTAARVADALERRARVTDRAWLSGLIADLADGTCSTLEHGFLTLVERPHGLPAPARQAPDGSTLGGVRRDADYTPLPLVLELDGRLFHDNATQRDRDLDRDLDLVAADRRGVRLGWGQVFDRPCDTAARLAAILTRAGWTGTAHPCSPSCPVPGSPGKI